MAAPRPSIQWIGSPNYRAQSGVSKDFYIVHWMVGNLAGTDAAFPRASYGVATQYGIEEGVIHQYVEDKDYAFGTGDTYANAHGIAVEHAGGWLMPDGSRYTPNAATMLSSARLLAYLADLYGWGRLQVGVNVLEHRNFVATECPGTTPTAALAAAAQEIREGGGKKGLTMKLLTESPNNGVGNTYYLIGDGSPRKFPGTLAQANEFNAAWGQSTQVVPKGTLKFWLDLYTVPAGGGVSGAPSVDQIDAKLAARFDEIPTAEQNGDAARRAIVK